MAIKTISTELSYHRPFVHFSTRVSRKTIKRLCWVFFILTVTGITVSMVVTTALPIELVFSAVLFFFGMWVASMQMYFYYNSFYFAGCNSDINSEGKSAIALTSTAASILLQDEQDVTAAFLRSHLGAEIIRRTEIPSEKVVALLVSERTLHKAASVVLIPHGPTTLLDIAQYLYMYDVAFAALCTQAQVSKELFLTTAALVSTIEQTRIKRERWWSRDALANHRVIGRFLAEGIPFALQCYSSTLGNGTLGNAVTTQQDQAVRTILGALSRSKAANVLLIGNPGVGIFDILSITKQYAEQKSGHGLLHTLHFVLLDIELLFANCPDSQSLENTLHQILQGAAQAGNYAIIIPDFSQVIITAHNRGIAIEALLDTYLTLPTIHIIATDTPHEYHTHLKNNSALLRRFEEILIEPEDVTHTIQLLVSAALVAEAKYGVEFSYPALITIATGADRYLTTSDMPERAILFLSEVAETAVLTNTRQITKDIVSALLSEKTGIPIGPISLPERDKLLQLEEILHTRIIGQDAAISALARTMRRARVDIERADKPIGSFLFLGPTGVGKTETAKALAHVFFGSETALVRFDMSEFSSRDSLPHLIGSPNETGRLSDTLIEHPYAVVLLDEFEKATPAVHDLFLQILDEGFFTNYQGTHINARNTIIIATSNAGSTLIETTKSIRKNNPSLDAEIIQNIIKTGTFKAELLNRFDNTIIFESLDQAEQAKVAALFLAEVTARMTRLGYTLVIEPTVCTELAARGFNEHFGARAMGRTIQDTIEDVIASRIIAGSVTVGDTIRLSRSDVFPNSYTE